MKKFFETQHPELAMFIFGITTGLLIYHLWYKYDENKLEG